MGVDDAKHIPNEVSPISYSLVPVANPANSVLPSSSWDIACRGWIIWMVLAARKKRKECPRCKVTGSPVKSGPTDRGGGW